MTTSKKQWTLDDMVDMTDKVVLVTGGNGGIGYVSCKMMLLKNAKVYVASRDSEKSHEAIGKLKEETGKDAFLIPLDLSDLHQVRKAAEDFLSKETKLDVLMNNAQAVLQSQYHDGYDSPFGVNVLGHFHFTALLMPAILASPSPRIINVASIAHELTFSDGIRFETLKGPKTGTRIFGLQLLQRLQYYGQSKLGNILHTNELVRRYADKGLVVISVHPGLVRSDLQRELSFSQKLFSNVTGRMVHQGKLCSTTEGAINQLYAANAPEAKEHSGKYIVPFATPGPTTNLGRDQPLAQKMWDWCETELKQF